MSLVKEFLNEAKADSSLPILTVIDHTGQTIKRVQDFEKAKNILNCYGDVINLHKPGSLKDSTDYLNVNKLTEAYSKKGAQARLPWGCKRPNENWKTMGMMADQLYKFVSDRVMTFTKDWNNTLMGPLFDDSTVGKPLDFGRT